MEDAWPKIEWLEELVSVGLGRRKALQIQSRNPTAM
jgi:hypothetical protein